MALSKADSAADGLAARAMYLVPGVMLCVGVAIAAAGLAFALRRTGQRVLDLPIDVPAIVVALVIGVALHRPASADVFAPGRSFCAKALLRFAVALLGLRLSLSDVASLGFRLTLAVLAIMAVTLGASLIMARALGCRREAGALIGSANAVCGASAALATSSVLPDYPGKHRDLVLTIALANAISTIVMLLYPLLCQALGLSAQQTGVVLGSTIQDMAQVVGAGYAVSADVGDTAVIVKMLRVVMLLPVVVAIGWMFLPPGARTLTGASRTVPGFAIAFLALALVNTMMTATAPELALWRMATEWAGNISSWSLLVAIAALGLSTSFKSLVTADWRLLMLFLAATVLILSLGLVAAIGLAA